MSHENREHNRKDWVIGGLATLIALSVVPSFFVFGWVYYLLFFLVAPLLLIAGVIYAIAGKPEVVVAQIHGIALPSDVRLHRGHGWARRAAPGCVMTGADDFVQRLIGPVESVETAAVGTSLAVGDPLAVLRRGEREIVIRAPIAGKVAAVNPLLGTEPGAINRSPYGSGWLVEMTPDTPNVASYMKELVGGGRAARWMRSEIDRLVALMAP
ncbi:MAG: glycine cleavage system protein H, partial [Polyangiaceae bacterium]|nr:glycine cleavage system protein H [Polyangiaceae bacterium]